MDEDGLGKLHGASTTNGNEPEMGLWEMMIKVPDRLAATRK